MSNKLATIRSQHFQSLQRQLIDEQAPDLLTKFRVRPAADSDTMVAKAERGQGNVIAHRVAFERDAKYVALGHRHPEHRIGFAGVGVSVEIRT